MSAQSKKTKNKTPSSGKNIAAKARKTMGQLTAQRFAATGPGVRVRSHVSSHNKRTQARRDSR
jgi:hypothetical protein